MSVDFRQVFNTAIEHYWHEAYRLSPYEQCVINCEKVLANLNQMLIWAFEDKAPHYYHTLWPTEKGGHLHLLTLYIKPDVEPQFLDMVLNAEVVWHGTKLIKHRYKEVDSE